MTEIPTNRRRYDEIFEPEALLGATFIDGKLQRPDYKMKFKTELCRNWEMTNECKFGSQCAFAHGGHELRRKLHTHDNYKTAPCRGFHERGYCLYGTRCQFIHFAACNQDRGLPSFNLKLKTTDYANDPAPSTPDSKLDDQVEYRLPIFRDLTESPGLNDDTSTTDNTDSDCSADLDQ